MRRGLVSAGVAVVLLSSMSLSAVSASQAVTPRCFGMAATIVGTEASETIRGTPGDDVIVGGGGAAPDYPGDKIYGRGGDDRICVRIRDESFTIVRGGLGDDQLQSSFYMFGGPGNDTLTEPARLALVIWVVGGRGDDVMRSRVTSTTYFVPGSGDDTLMGAVGSYISNVAIFRGAHRGLVLDLGRGTVVGQGDDLMYGINYVYGSKHADVLIGDEASNNLLGQGGADVLLGRGGLDVLVADVGNGRRHNDDYLDGGAGNDFLVGGKGSDTLIGRVGDDHLTEMPAAEPNLILAGPGIDTCVGDYPVPPTIERGCEIHMDCRSGCSRWLGGGVKTPFVARGFPLFPALR